MDCNQREQELYNIQTSGLMLSELEIEQLKMTVQARDKTIHALLSENKELKYKSEYHLHIF